MRSFITIVGYLTADPILAYRPGSPGEEVAVCTFTVLTEADPTISGGRVTAEPTEYTVKASGPMAEHANDTFAACDRVIVVGTIVTSRHYDRLTRRPVTETWIRAMEIGPSIAETAIDVPRRTVAQPQLPAAA